MPQHSKKIKRRYAEGKRYTVEATVNKRRTNCSRWLLKAKEKFDDKFDYSKAELAYKTQKSPKVPIRCIEHNVTFSQTPDKHLQSRLGGCTVCRNNSRNLIRHNIKKKEFMEWFQHNRKDNLEITSEFINMTTDLKFKCKIHQTEGYHKPSSIMGQNSHGCNLCAKEATSLVQRSDPKEIESEFKDILPENISIKEIFFDKELNILQIVPKCEFHGLQMAYSVRSFRRSQSKCRDCSALKQGYAGNRLRVLIDSEEKGSICNLAIMTMEVFGISAMKLGVTTRTLGKRYLHYLKKIEYQIQLFEIDAYVLENRIKLNFSDFNDKRIIYKGMRTGSRWPGDTEFFFSSQKQNIINFIDDFVREIKNTKVDYEQEFESLVVPKSFPVSVGRDKGKWNLPIPVIGIDKDTHEKIYDLESYDAAHKLGFKNLASIISEKNGRTSSKGIRWFKKESFELDNIPPIKIPNAQPVFCVERNQHFQSTVEAEVEMKKLGFKVNSSKISTVLNGHRKKAGGFSWKRSTLTIEEIINQEKETFIEFRPKPASNDKKRTKLMSTTKDTDIKFFDSISSAAKELGVQPGTISNAIKDKKIIRGYKVSNET